MAPRVLVDPYLDASRISALLAGLDVAVEPVGGPLGGDDVVGVIVWESSVGDAQLARLPNVRVVVTPSVGFDHVDLDAARRHGGVHVCNIPDYCFEEMADTALAMVLALMRGIVTLDRSVRDGRWDEKAAGPLRRIHGTRLGVVGFGHIGAALARRARALGFEVWATDPAVPPGTIAGTGVTPASLGELLGACHVVSLHAPLTPQTRGLIGKRELARMPRGSLLVNTARGLLVDTDALLEALESGHLAGAALDVLPVEPPTAEHPVPRADTLIVTPHSGYHSPEAEAEMYRRAAEAVRDALEGRTPRAALVTPDGAAA